MDRAAALELLKSHVKNRNLVKHCLACSPRVPDEKAIQQELKMRRFPVSPSSAYGLRPQLSNRCSLAAFLDSRCIMAPWERSPIQEWRERQGMTRADLAQARGLPTGLLAKVEAGQEGLVGELQDYLTKQGENVSWLASEQAAFFSSMQRDRDSSHD